MQLNWKEQPDGSRKCGPFTITKGQHPNMNIDTPVLELHFDGRALAWTPNNNGKWLEEKANLLTVDLFANVQTPGTACA
jgi:hypothetical protein